MRAIRHLPPGLAKTTALHRLLVEPAPVPVRLDAGLRRVLASKIAAHAPGRHLGSLRLDSFTVLADPERLEGRSPFTWSPRTARRLIGLAAARRVVAGQALSPLAAVGLEISGAVERATSARTRPGALGTWLTEVPSGLLAAVTAEATNYATDVVTLVDFGSFAERVDVGPADPVWAVPGAPWVSLRARRDLEVSLDTERQTRALVALRAGRPTHGAPDDLGLVALIDALSRPDAPMATRVVGVWPSSGRTMSLEIDAESMRRGARQVVEAVDRRGRAGAAVLAA